MDFILDNIFIIILLFVGAISQWLKSRGEAAQDKDPGFDPTDFEEMIEEAERRQSLPAVPPPLPSPVFNRPQQGPAATPVPALRRSQREAARPAAATYDSGAELARQEGLAKELKEMKRAKGARATADQAIPRIRPAGTSGPIAATTLNARLRSRRELRQAFVLREILEKPLGLR